MPVRARLSERGFTLMEAVIVIAITGIIAVMVAVFIRGPIQGYFAASARADMSDVADTSLRRIARDLRLALPNSVRVSVNNLAIEILQTRTGGRYRASTGTSTADDILDFSQNDTSFDLLGPTMTFNAGDQIVIYNLGIDGADAYQGNTATTHVRRAVSAAGVGTGTNVKIDSTNPFPFDSPNHSFQVVETPVSYICDLGARTLTRYWNYDIQPAQPYPPSAGAGLKSALLATNVSACTFVHTTGVTARSGLVSIQLAISQGVETINLHHEVHVSNVP